MERRRKSRYLIWLFPLVVMIMIFSFSGQQGEESSSMSNIFVNLFLQIRGTLGLFPKFADAELVNLISLVVRKGAHVTEYVLLCTSFLTAFWVSGVRGKWRNIGSFVFTFGYACSDEFHQLFVPGRAGQFRDVLIDSSGALLLSIIVLLVMCIRRKKNAARDREKIK